MRNLKMASYNEITGDKIQTRDSLSEQGQDNYDKIFGKRKTNGGWKPPSLDTPVATPDQPMEYSEDWQSSKRDRAIAQNGNIGYEIEEDK